MSDETTITKRIDPGVSGGAVELKTMDDLRWFCGTMAKSRLVPAAYQGKPEDILVCIQHGAELGLKPLQSLNTIAVINGRPTLYGDGIPALLDASGLCEDRDEYIEGEGDKMTAVCRLKRRGMQTPILRTFSVSDAKAAGLWGKAGPWTQYPKRMLAMRARSWAARDGFADVLRGLHVREEVADYDVARTPQRPATVTLTPDGRIAADEPHDAAETATEDVVDVEAVASKSGELF